MTATLLWRLASPYDAYVSHVSRLDEAVTRIRQLSDVALGYEAGLQGSGRVVPGGADSASRAATFRDRLGAAAAELSDEQFEEFVTMLGGGDVADVDHDRSRTQTRLRHATRGLEEYFAIAGQELATLEKRGYNPHRPDVARQLRDNHLPEVDVAGYRHLLHELGSRVAQRQN